MQGLGEKNLFIAFGTELAFQGCPIFFFFFYAWGTE